MSTFQVSSFEFYLCRTKSQQMSPQALQRYSPIQSNPIKLIQIQIGLIHTKKRKEKKVA